jgi:hypothetical protein
VLLVFVWLLTYDLPAMAGARHGERVGCLRSSRQRDISYNEWPSLAGLLYSHDNAMAHYRAWSSFIDVALIVPLLWHSLLKDKSSISSMTGVSLLFMAVVMLLAHLL